MHRSLRLALGYSVILGGLWFSGMDGALGQSGTTLTSGGTHVTTLDQTSGSGGTGNGNTAPSDLNSEVIKGSE